MELPLNFQFTQANMQDFVDCRKRFRLKAIERRSWPAIETEPVMENERHMQLGVQFHHLVHQYLLGIPAEKLKGMVEEEELAAWWENFIDASPEPLRLLGEEAGFRRYPEVTVSAALGDYRIAAKYDLVLANDDGRLIVYDWKTSRRKPRREWLQERLQTRVYLYLLVTAGAQFLAGRTPDPEKVMLVYWYANKPGSPERFSYSQSSLESDQAYFYSLIDLILSLEPDAFSMTMDVQRCSYCVYRSLCDRGVQAGDWQAAPGWEQDVLTASQVVFDFEQIAEIEF